MMSKIQLWQCKTPHISVCDRHTFGLNGWLPRNAALLQRHLPVREASSVRAGGPWSTWPAAIRRGHTVGRHVHGSHHVIQLGVVLRVRFCPADSVGTHGGLVLFNYSWTSQSTKWCITALRDVETEKWDSVNKADFLFVKCIFLSWTGHLYCCC